MTDTVLVIVETLASTAALLLALSPGRSMYSVLRTKSTDRVSILPLATLWIVNHMWFVYGIVTQDYFPLVVTYGVGDVLSILYICVFVTCTHDRRHALGVVALAFAWVAAASLYTALALTGVFHHSVGVTRQVIGIVTIVACLLLYSSPFTTVAHVIRTKSSSSIPIAMCVAGILNNVLWLLYAVLISDILQVIPTVFSITFGFFQVGLYIVYHPRVRNGRNQVTTLSPVALEGYHPSVVAYPQDPTRGTEKADDGMISAHVLSAASPTYVELQSPSIGR